MSLWTIPGVGMNYGITQPTQQIQRPEARNFWEMIRMNKAEEEGHEADVDAYCNQVSQGSYANQSQMPSTSIFVIGGNPMSPAISI